MKMRQSAPQIRLKMAVGWGGTGWQDRRIGWNIAVISNIKSFAAGVAVVGCVVGIEKDKTSLGATTCVRA